MNYPDPPRWRWTKNGMEIDLVAGEFCFVADIPRLVAWTEPLSAETLAQALHDHKNAGGFIGCGWKFASEVDGEAMCPCPAEARDLLARLLI